MVSRRTGSTGGGGREPVAGLGVDAFGGPMIDPTANTIAGLAGAVTRLDDLREETDKRYDRELWWTRYVAELRSKHAMELAVAESKRLDANRQVDVTAVGIAAERTRAEVVALATVAKTDAENVRRYTDDTIGRMNERVLALEKASYLGAGKQEYVDPQLAELVREMRSLSQSRATGEGKSEGMSTTAKVAIAGIGLVATMLGIMGTLVMFAGVAWALIRFGLS